MTVSRRAFLGATLSGLTLAAVHRTHAGTGASARNVPPALLDRALAALQRHEARIEHRDLIGIADFSLPSSAPRLYLVNLADGAVSSHLVAHGRGSDPTHTGWLQRFSNEPHSNATSAGAYRTGSLYVGGHGPALHLDGLDPTNSNASARAIVVHGAWYVSPHLLDTFGRLGRSEGCFAVGTASLGEILAKLGAGRPIYADKV